MANHSKSDQPTKSFWQNLPPKRRLLPLLVVLAIILGLYAYRTNNQRQSVKDVRAIAASGGIHMKVRITTSLYLQGDRRWGAKKLGKTDSSLANYGCTVCATAMALTARGLPIFPDQLNEGLNKNSGFTESGLLIWKAVTPVSGDQFSVGIVDKPTHEWLDQQLQRNNPIITKVLYKGRIWHWVLITGKEGKEYLIHDPLSPGKGFEPLSKNYGTGIFTCRYLK